MDQVVFFPPTRPGTLLFSHVVQYHVLVGNTSNQRTRQDLFGNPNASVAGRFGGQSGRLYESALSRRYATPGAMLRSHTLVPYYAAFLPESAAAAWEEELLWRTGRTLNRFLGGPTRSLYRRNLHQCLGCVARDEDKAGVASWHLAHQLPGVALCPWHWEPLIGNCEHCKSPIATEFRWGLPTSTCPTCQRPLCRPVSSEVPKKYRQFVTSSVALLYQTSSAIAPESRLERYRARLSQMASATSQGLGARLGQLLTQKWDVPTLAALADLLDLPVTETLLERAAKGTDALAYPALHLLLSDALDLDLFDAGQRYAPNAEFDAATVAIWRDALPAEIRAATSSAQELAQRAPEIAALGKALQARSIPPYLAVALFGGLTIGYVHRHFGVSAYRLAAVMNEVASNGQVSMSYKPQTRAPRNLSASEARRAGKVDAARTKVLALIASGDVTRRAQLELIIGKTLVAFMRRWDREWFDRTLPSKGPERQSRISDLAAFDAALAAKLVGLQEEALQRGKLRRPSVALACKLAGFRLDYYFATGGLPKCHALMASESSKTPPTHTLNGVRLHHENKRSRIADLAAFDADLAATLKRLQRGAPLRDKARRLSVSLACKTAGFRLDYYFATGALPKSHALIRGSSQKASAPTHDSVDQRETALNLTS